MCIDLAKEIDKNINEISWKSLNNKKTKNIEITYKEIKDYFTKLSENESPIIILENEIESRKEEFETNIKLVDCVGLVVPEANGFKDEDGNPRMVKCPCKY